MRQAPDLEISPAPPRPQSRSADYFPTERAALPHLYLFISLDFISLDFTRLDFIRLDFIGLDFISLDQPEGGDGRPVGAGSP